MVWKSLSQQRFRNYFASFADCEISNCESINLFLVMFWPGLISPQESDMCVISSTLHIVISLECYKHSNEITICNAEEKNDSVINSGAVTKFKKRVQRTINTFGSMLTHWVKLAGLRSFKGIFNRRGRSRAKVTICNFWYQIWNPISICQFWPTFCPETDSPFHLFYN